MAQIVAANVTATIVTGSATASPSSPRFSALFDITFGDGTATYTSGGIPLTGSKFGCPANVLQLEFINPSAGDALTYKYNHTANTIQIYSSSHVHGFIMAGGVTTTADFLYNSTGTLGKAAATNVTISGTSPTTTGGVVSVVALAELSTTTTVSATSLRVRVAGY